MAEWTKALHMDAALSMLRGFESPSGPWQFSWRCGCRFLVKNKTWKPMLSQLCIQSFFVGMNNFYAHDLFKASVSGWRSNGGLSLKPRRTLVHTGNQRQILGNLTQKVLATERPIFRAKREESMHISPTVTPLGGITGGQREHGNIEILSSRSF